MLDNNCRIEKINGYRFYEKDVLYDDYTFTHDIKITADINYISAGFGIVLIDANSTSLKDVQDSYLFKIGYKEAGIYYSNDAGLTLIKETTCLEAKTIQEHLSFKLIKEGKKISIYINNNLAVSEYVKKELDKYSIGYYSNSGNIINNIKIEANIPDNWTVNMKNTKGGYIRFYNNCFEISDCLSNAEIEQSNILLKKGTYYLSYKKELLNEKNDIKAYVYKSDDNRIYDSKKNLLNSHNCFTLKEDTCINLKIVGKNGKIGNIMISEEEDADYIPTTSSNVKFDGSYIDILTANLSKITWKGTIIKTPYHILNAEYGIILDNSSCLKPETAGILYNHEYFYEFDIKKYLLTIYDGNEKIYSYRILDIIDKVTIFKNMSSRISQLTIQRSNGEIMDIVTEDTNTDFVNANISSPIVVVDEYDLPLDLSSSYRHCFYDKYDKYVFTNWEREYFYSKNILRLESSVLEQDDAIFVYGIKDIDDLDFDKFFDVKDDNINSIDLFSQNYDFIDERMLLDFDKSKGLIYLKDSDTKKYKMFVVDYLKRDSYAINYNYMKNIYEVDISSLNNNKILYDSLDIQDDNKLMTQIENYKITDISANQSGYVTLSEGGK